jgi:hypothetical protein
MNVIANMMRTGNDPRIRRSGRSSLSASDRLARNLGWFSLALGLTEVVAGGRIARALGLRDKASWIRSYGLREIGSGILCLSIDKKAGLMSRVAGDGLDLATLSHGLNRFNPKRDNVVIAMALVAGIGVLDLLAAKLVMSRHGEGSEPPRDYRDRSGFPSGIQAARGRARDNTQRPDPREVPVVA